MFFASNSIVSLPYVLEDGVSAEISVLGNEGLIGIALFMGDGILHRGGRSDHDGLCLREGRRAEDKAGGGSETAAIQHDGCPD